MSGARCCCEPACRSCVTPPCGYSSVTFESTLNFKFGFPPGCVCTDGYIEGQSAVDANTDIGALTLPVDTAGGFCIYRKTSGGTGVYAWTPPTYPDAQWQCLGISDPYPLLGPWLQIRLRCVIQGGVAYGEVIITLVRHNCSGFGSETAEIRYRRLADADCDVPLGVYDFYSTTLDATWFGCALPLCGGLNETLEDLNYGTVTIS